MVNDQTKGERITVTHVVGKAVARAFADSPGANALLSLGRMKRRTSVDVFFSVAVDGGKNLSGAKIEPVSGMAQSSRDRGPLGGEGGSGSSSDGPKVSLVLLRCPTARTDRQTDATDP